ncbi:tetratricopeptide repeat protein [Hymenobacter sp. DG25B]|jgi:tetratricopeptide (TPR) repeat protein|uniref:tetratricopeptide repeat protein n=1 Tax=Hymenobacter sp. DG25B TaxID=1385664 RepID=UPI0005CA7AFF|nr:tetratricopeptide repeat protein [Hymenobacter sp. DG25B]
MKFKPWKLSLLVALSATSTAAFAQDIAGAQKAMNLERYSEARRMLAQGQSPEAAVEMGRLYLLMEKPDSAAYFFNKGVTNAKSPQSMVAAGRAFLAQGKKAEAEIQFDNAVKASKSKDKEILTMIGQAYAESNEKDTKKAIEYLNLATKLNKKDDPRVMVLLGDLYLKQENGGGDAMNAYERATLADPNYVQAYFRKGQLNVRSRNYNGARDAFQKVISIDPNYAPAYRELGEMYYLIGKYDDALSTFQKYRDMAENTPSTQAKYASFLFLTKKYPEALTEIQKNLQADPKNVTMNRLQAYALYETGQNDKALPAMEAYMKNTPADKIITQDYIYQGKMLAKAGRSEEGIAMIKKAIAADPTQAADLQNDLAQAYIASKNYPMAIATYRAKLQDGKGDLTDNVYLARAYEFNKQYAQADSLYGVILTARPTYVPGYLMRARANANLDPDSKQGTAKPYYEKYIEVANANDPSKYTDGLVEANKYLGYYYYQKGDKAASLPYWQAAKTLAPGDAQATTAINEITKKAAPRKTTTTTKKTTVKQK